MAVSVTEPVPDRQLVLEAARELFNRRGTVRVTTGQVAQRAGVPPASLRREFRTKAQLVAALVDEWLESVADHDDDRPLDVNLLWDDLTRTAVLAQRYRFVLRELPAVLADDAALAGRYRAVHDHRHAALVDVVRRLVGVGVLLPPTPPRTVDDLALALSLLAEGWVTRTAVEGFGIGSGLQVVSGVRPLLVVLGPYLSDQGLRSVEVL